MQEIAGAGSPADLCRPAVPELEGRLPGSADTGCGGLAATSGLLVAALVNLALHQLINHKEYRYIWLSIEILLLITAFRSVDLLQVMFRRDNPAELEGSRAAAALVRAWAVVSALLASTDDPSSRLSV